jgi:chaperone BCS1
MNMAGMTDGRIEGALEELPPRSILLIEDIDCATASFLTREDNNDDNKLHRVLGSIDSSKDSTLSGILNILDGINTPDSIIIMMTTNYPERIDPAILRKGRTDHRIVLTSLNDEAIRRYAAYAYHGNQLTRSKPFNPIKGCDLQSLIFENDDILSFEKALIELQ